MKTTWRDSATILMAFAAVFLCGYGIGHLVGGRHKPAPALEAVVDPWQEETLNRLDAALQLRPEQRPRVSAELNRTAEAISSSRAGVILEYHQHLDQLYGRLIKLLDQEQANRLRKEKKLLEERIRSLSDG